MMVVVQVGVLLLGTAGTASGLLSLRPSLSPRAPTLRMVDSAKPLLHEHLLPVEVTAYKTAALKERALNANHAATCGGGLDPLTGSLVLGGGATIAGARAMAVACRRHWAELQQQIASSSFEIDPSRRTPGPDRARRGVVQAFSAWAVGALVGTAAAMASEGATAPLHCQE